ncbi:MAG: beta-ketoacyl-ACP synthase III [Galactobacter sp.]
MKKRVLRGSALLGLGHYQPEKVLTNSDIEKLVDTNDEWIVTRTGIKERRVVEDHDNVVSMGVAAARMALEDAGVDSVDLVIVTSVSTETLSPNNAAKIAVELGLDGPGVIDVNTACSGFEYALALADQAISTGASERALVIGSEELTRITDWTDRTTCVLTADGAGAAVVGASEENHISGVVWGSVPELAEAVEVKGQPRLFSQNGRGVMRWALTGSVKIAKQILAEAEVKADDIDVYAFHQANLRIIEPLAKGLKAREDQIVLKDIEVSGNTSAASVPLALSKAWHAGELPRGGRTLLFGFGGGFTYAGLVADLPA